MACVMAGALCAAAGSGQEPPDPLVRAEQLVAALRESRDAAPILAELASLGTAIEVPLGQRWRQLPEPVDEQALGLLCALGRSSSLQALGEAATSGLARHRRQAAILASDLEGLDPPRVTAVLVRLLHDQDPETHAAALWVLSQAGPANSWPPLFELARAQLAADPDSRECALTLRALARLLQSQPGAEGVEQVLGACQDAEPATQLAWLSVLAASESPACAEAVRPLLAACYAEPGGAEDPLRALGLPAGPPVRVLLVRCLGLAGDPRSFPLVLRALQDPATEVRREALRFVWYLAIGEDARAAAIRAVVDLLLDPDHPLREEAHLWLLEHSDLHLPLSHLAWSGQLTRSSGAGAPGGASSAGGTSPGGGGPPPTAGGARPGAGGGAPVDPPRAPPDFWTLALAGGGSLLLLVLLVRLGAMPGARATRVGDGRLAGVAPLAERLEQEVAPRLAQAAAQEAERAAMAQLPPVDAFQGGASFHGPVEDRAYLEQLQESLGALQGGGVDPARLAALEALRGELRPGMSDPDFAAWSRRLHQQEREAPEVFTSEVRLLLLAIALRLRRGLEVDEVSAVRWAELMARLRGGARLETGPSVARVEQLADLRREVARAEDHLAQLRARLQALEAEVVQGLSEAAPTRVVAAWAASTADADGPETSVAAIDATRPVTPTSPEDGTRAVGRGAGIDETLPVAPNAPEDGTRAVGRGAGIDETQPVAPQEPEPGTRQVGPQGLEPGTRQVEPQEPTEGTRQVRPGPAGEGTRIVSRAAAEDDPGQGTREVRASASDQGGTRLVPPPGAPSLDPGQAHVLGPDGLPAPSGPAARRTARLSLGPAPDLALGRRLGRGAQGSVWEAELEGRRVAVKLLGADGTGAGLERLVREAELCSSIESPHVVRTEGLRFSLDGKLYLVMEYVEGETLMARLRRAGQLPLPEVLRAGEHLARALIAAGAVGVVHRDVKPHNVLVTPNGAHKLADFGIGRQEGQDSGITVTGTGMGTLPYTAPEQIREAKAATPRSDVYGLGATLFHLLTGRKVIEDPTAGTRSDAGSLGELLAELARGRPRARALRADCPPALDELLDRMLAFAPEDRPDAQEVLSRLLALLPA